MTLAEDFLRANNLDPALMEDKFDREDFDIKHYKVRREYIRKFGFAILTRDTIEALRPYSPIVEVGSGSAYWAYELQKAGLDVIATEPYPERRGKYANAKWKMYTVAEKLWGPKAARKYPNRTLLLVWPDYLSRWPAATLSAYNGNCVIYVGEGAGGCTGDDRFHEILDEKFYCEQVICIPTFYATHDCLKICRRKNLVVPCGVAI